MPTLEEKLEEIFQRKNPPEAGPYLETVRGTLETLGSEPASIRPPDAEGRPGGLVLLNPGLPTIIVPDIHARMDFFLSVLRHEAEEGGRVLDLLAEGRMQVVCLGDGVHAEGRAARRWKAAQKEFQEGYRNHRNMDEEMRESLGVMEMVMEVKQSCPAGFHFLKGNHENIGNELGGGNFPFRKFAMEGLMVLTYMRSFYGEDLLGEYAAFEKELPLLAAGRNFLISHAEPQSFFPRQLLVEYRRYPEATSGLTWTDNGEAEEDSVKRMLDAYLSEGERGRSYYFAGHRPTAERYRLRAEGKLVQIHDPDRFMIAHIPAWRDIELDTDIKEIENRSPMAV